MIKNAIYRYKDDCAQFKRVGQSNANLFNSILIPALAVEHFFSMTAFHLVLFHKSTDRDRYNCLILKLTEKTKN